MFSCEIPVTPLSHPSPPHKVETTAEQRVAVEVWDKDRVSNDELLGSCEERLDHLASLARRGAVPELRWVGLGASDRWRCTSATSATSARLARLRMSYEWIPASPSPTGATSGLLSVCCTSLTPSLPGGGATRMRPSIKVA